MAALGGGLGSRERGAVGGRGGACWLVGAAQLSPAACCAAALPNACTAGSAPASGKRRSASAVGEPAEGLPTLLLPAALACGLPVSTVSSAASWKECFRWLLRSAAAAATLSAEGSSSPAGSSGWVGCRPSATPLPGPPSLPLLARDTALPLAAGSSSLNSALYLLVPSSRLLLRLTSPTGAAAAFLGRGCRRSCRPLLVRWFAAAEFSSPDSSNASSSRAAAPAASASAGPGGAGSCAADGSQLAVPALHSALACRLCSACLVGSWFERC